MKENKKKLTEEILSELIHDGYELHIGVGYITIAENSYTYRGDKEFIVIGASNKDRGFNTVLGAMNYLERY